MNHQWRRSVPANVKRGLGQGLICHSDQFWLLQYRLAAYMRARIFIAGAAVLVLITLPSYHLPQSIPANDRSPSVGTREGGRGRGRRDGAQRRGRWGWGGRCLSKCGLVSDARLHDGQNAHEHETRRDKTTYYHKLKFTAKQHFVQSIHSGLNPLLKLHIM